MTVDEIIQMLRSRIVHLSAVRTAAQQLGDVERVATLDADIAETTTTLTQLESL